MNRRAKGSIPASREITRRVKCLGKDAAKEYFTLREGYKGQGLTVRESIERACTELQVQERYEDWRRRSTAAEMLGKQVPMTPAEVQEVFPTYQVPGMTKAEEVGEKEMSLAEQVAWAKKWSARVQNGEPAPTKFPSEGALFWFQSALSNRREFEKVVLRVESPVADGSDPYLRDGQYQFKEIEGQIREAVRESGERLVEMEAGFRDLLKEQLLKEQLLNA